MDKTTKQMIKQLTDNYYNFKKVVIEQNQNESPQQNIFQTTDEIVKGYIKDIHDQVGNVHMSFDDLKFDPQSKRVHWSGDIAGVNWSAIYSESPDGTGFYFTVNNKKMATDATLGLHKLNIYFHTVWFSAIRDAILNNELNK